MHIRKAIGLQPDERGLLDVDNSYQTAVDGIYACGDVIGYPALASTSMEQGTRAAHHMWNMSDEVRDRNLIYRFYLVLFSYSVHFRMMWSFF